MTGFGFTVSAGVSVIPVESKIENGFALPPIEEFEKLIGPRTKGIIICNPNNPTGYLYSREEVEQLGKIILKHDLYLYSDEVYREFAYDGKQHYSVLQEPGMDAHAIMVDSVSKRYSMCGARIGCMVSRNLELMQAAL